MERCKMIKKENDRKFRYTDIIYNDFNISKYQDIYDNINTMLCSSQKDNIRTHGNDTTTIKYNVYLTIEGENDLRIYKSKNNDNKCKTTPPLVQERPLRYYAGRRNAMEQDMSRGNPTRLILLFLLPIIGGSLFQQFYSMVDTIIVGRFIGVKALAAVGSTGGVSFFVLGFVIGLTAGFSVIISQKFGAKDLDSMRKAISMSILTASVVSIVVSTLAVLLCRPLLLVMNTPYDIIDDATSYLRIIFIGIIATIYYNLLASILRALGDSKSPLFFLLIASVLNIIGDLIAVLILDMGVQGDRKSVV